MALVTCLRLEAQLTCPACRQITSAVTLTEAVPCDGCQAPLPLRGAVEPLLVADRMVLDHCAGGRQEGALAAGVTLTAAVRWSAERPWCPGCGASVDPARLLEASAADPALTAVSCPRCLATLPVRVPQPAWSQLAPGLRLVVGESLAASELPPGFFLLYEEDEVLARALEAIAAGDALDASVAPAPQHRRLLLESAPIPSGIAAALAQTIFGRAMADGAPSIPEAEPLLSEAQDDALALACNRHLPASEAAAYEPPTAEALRQWLELRDDLPVARLLSLFDGPLEPSPEDALALLERQREWGSLVARADRGPLSMTEARLLLGQRWRPDLYDLVARNPLLPKEVMSQLARVPRWQVAVLENPAIPVGLLQLLATRGATPEVRALAAAHPRHPRTFWQRLWG